MILVIDNYDSFTYNLVQYLGELGAETLVRRNDVLTAQEMLALRPQGVVLSPGPCTPDKAGVCLDLIAAAPDNLAILGVCLGHQAIGQAMGGDVVRAQRPMHGKISAISHRGGGLYDGLADPFNATRYHSLIVAKETLPDCLEIEALSEDGEIMGFAHRQRPLWGVQFHPESIATEGGHRLLANFLGMAGAKPTATA